MLKAFGIIAILYFVLISILFIKDYFILGGTIDSVILSNYGEHIGGITAFFAMIFSFTVYMNDRKNRAKEIVRLQLNEGFMQYNLIVNSLSFFDDDKKSEITGKRVINYFYEKIKSSSFFYTYNGLSYPDKIEDMRKGMDVIQSLHYYQLRPLLLFVLQQSEKIDLQNQIEKNEKINLLNGFLDLLSPLEIVLFYYLILIIPSYNEISEIIKIRQALKNCILRNNYIDFLFNKNHINYEADH